jgi:hypothetical protein
MEWLAQNWFWLLVFAAFVVLHLVGHGGHGGHGGRRSGGGGTPRRPPDECGGGRRGSVTENGVADDRGAAHTERRHGC